MTCGLSYVVFNFFEQYMKGWKVLACITHHGKAFLARLFLEKTQGITIALSSWWCKKKFNIM